MKCPKCESTLIERTAENKKTKVDICPTCKGLWLDSGELEAMMHVAAKELTVPSRAEASERPCPVCLKPLFSFHYPQTRVKVDMCKRCGGLWLDFREFRKIKQRRARLKKRGKLEEYAPVGGLKGVLLRLIDSALEALNLDKKKAKKKARKKRKKKAK